MNVVWILLCVFVFFRFVFTACVFFVCCCFVFLLVLILTHHFCCNRILFLVYLLKGREGMIIAHIKMILFLVCPFLLLFCCFATLLSHMSSIYIISLHRFVYFFIYLFLLFLLLLLLTY